MLSIELGASRARRAVSRVGGKWRVPPQSQTPAARCCRNRAGGWGGICHALHPTAKGFAYNGATNGHANTAGDRHGRPVSRCPCATHTAPATPGVRLPSVRMRAKAQVARIAR